MDCEKFVNMCTDDGPLRRDFHFFFLSFPSPDSIFILCVFHQYVLIVKVLPLLSATSNLKTSTLIITSGTVQQFFKVFCDIWSQFSVHLFHKDIYGLSQGIILNPCVGTERRNHHIPKEQDFHVIMYLTSFLKLGFLTYVFHNHHKEIV